MGTEVYRPPLSDTHREETVDERFRRPDAQVQDVAAALLHLAPADRRVFIGPLIAMIERVATDGELPPADRSMIPDPVCSSRRRIIRLSR